MSVLRCCDMDENAGGPPQTKVVSAAASTSLAQGIGRRLADGARVLLPAAGLALLPKCPACLAAYIAIGTGIGLSMTAATYLRILLMAGCLASLAIFAAPRLRRIVMLLSGSPKSRFPLSYPRSLNRG